MIKIMKKILVPVDFSDTSGRLLAVAEEEARAHGAELLLFHVIEPVAELSAFETNPQFMEMEAGPDLAAEEGVLQKRLAELAATVQQRGLSCQSSVALGLPAHEILAAVQEHHSDCVVMGSHGHGAIFHLFTGSVVTAVLKKINCPVLVVPLRGKVK